MSNVRIRRVSAPIPATKLYARIYCSLGIARTAVRLFPRIRHKFLLVFFKRSLLIWNYGPCTVFPGKHAFVQRTLTPTILHTTCCRVPIPSSMVQCCFHRRTPDQSDTDVRGVVVRFDALQQNFFASRFLL